MQVGKDHWLEANSEGYPAVLKVPSIRSSVPDVPEPLGIVWHWTAGKGGTPGFAPALANEIRTYDKTKDRPASWHVLIAKDGRMFQSVAFNLGSWHVGRPGKIGGLPVKVGGLWNASAFPTGRLFANVNKATVGVELENAGRLVKVADKFYCWPYWLDPDNHNSSPDPKYELPAVRAVAVGGEWFDDFPPAQEQAAQRLLSALALKYGWKREVCQYTHFQFDPGRKEDAGPRWMEVVLPRILDRVFGSSTAVTPVDSPRVA